MTRDKIKNTPELVDYLLDESVTADSRKKIHKRMEEICNLAIQALEQETEPVFFPPCVDCQNRSKEILTAYNNMINKKTFTKEEVITMLDKIRAEIEQITDTINVCYYQYVNKIDVLQIIDKYKAESEEKE